MISAPAGFVRHQFGPSWVILDETISSPKLATRLADPEPLTVDRNLTSSTGRGPRGLLELGASETLLIKRCLRGGWLARINSSRYFLLSRFHRELQASQHAHRVGLPCGETRAVVIQPAAPGWHVWAASRWIEQAEDFGQRWLASDEAERAALWHHATEFVARVAAAGIAHPDLNLGNLLIEVGKGESVPRIWLIDFDRCRVVGREQRERVEQQMLARMRQSRSRLEASTERRVS